MTDSKRAELEIQYKWKLKCKKGINRYLQEQPYHSMNKWQKDFWRYMKNSVSIVAKEVSILREVLYE